MKRILIVDDDVQNLYMLQVLLEAHGYQVESAENGALALELARQTPPDMIVTDILMPVMDGFALCREWKADPKLSARPFIFYTATYTDPKDEEFALSLGAERFIVKPADPTKLTNIIKDVIAAHETGQLAAPYDPIENNTVYLKEYNETLIRKLEDKVADLEREIGERRQTEEALRESEARWRSLTESSPDYIVVLDADLNIQFMNHALPGQNISDLIGLPLHTFVATKEQQAEIKTILSSALQTGEATIYETEYHVPDGEIICYESRVAPRILHGKMIGLTLSIRDITERKRVEELQILAHMKDEFVSNVSHELRSPISSLTLRRHLLEKQPERINEHIAVIERETERLAHIIDDLLILSQMDQQQARFELMPVDLNTLIQQFVADRMLLAESRDLNLTYDSAPNLSIIRADTGLLEQALGVLLTNALNYTPAGGEIVVSTHIQQSDGREWVGFRVSDSGPGISEEEQEQLFTRFFRGSAGRDSGAAGTGLGLAIAKRNCQTASGANRSRECRRSGAGGGFQCVAPRP